MEPLNNGQVEDEHFVHCSEVVLQEVEMYRDTIGRLSTLQSVHYRYAL